MVLRDLLGLARKKMLNVNFQTEFIKWGTREGICNIEYDRQTKIFAKKSKLKMATNDSIHDNEDDRHMKIFRKNRARHEAY
jgi:hypothetical protein